MSQFPPEITDTFFGNLESDRGSLMAVSLVCSYWADIARPRLFRQFSVQGQIDKELDEPWRRLLDALTTSPHLSTHFHLVELSFSIGHSIAKDPSFFRLLGLFSCVKTLKLRSVGNNWGKMNPGLLRALEYIISRPTFQHLEIGTWQFDPTASQLVAFLRNCSPSLQQLGLASLSYSDDGVSRNVGLLQSIDLPKLKRFCFFGHAPLPPEILMDMPCVEAIYMPIHHADHKEYDGSYCNGLPRSSTSRPARTWTLHLLNIDGESDFTPCDSINIEDMINIRHLELVLPCPIEKRNFEIYDFGKFLKKFPVANLVSIQIRLLVGHVYRIYWDKSAWSRLAKRLKPLVEVAGVKNLKVVLTVLSFPGRRIYGEDPFHDRKRQESVTQGVRVMKEALRRPAVGGKLEICAEFSPQETLW